MNTVDLDIPHHVFVLLQNDNFLHFIFNFLCSIFINTLRLTNEVEFDCKWFKSILKLDTRAIRTKGYVSTVT